MRTSSSTPCTPDLPSEGVGRKHRITILEVWEVLDSDRRLFGRVGERAMIVLGTTQSVRHLLVLVHEAEHEPDTWDIVAAREMSQQEISQFRRTRGGPHA